MSVELLTAARALTARRGLVRPGSPAELARRLDPRFRVTPTIRLLSDIARRWVVEPDQRDIVNTPPRTGKSELFAIWTPVWALMRDPELRIVVVSHGDDLAQTHSRKVRAIIREHSEFSVFRLRRIRRRWAVGMCRATVAGSWPPASRRASPAMVLTS